MTIIHYIPSIDEASGGVGLVFKSGQPQQLKECLSYCIGNKDEIRQTVSDRIVWARNNINGKASAEYFLSCIAK